jgi:hypothetical protein
MIMIIELRYEVLFVCYDGYMFNKSQSGSVQVVVVIVLVMVIAGSLGFVVWDKFLAPKSNEVPSSLSGSTSVRATDIKSTNDLNEGYLVIKDWNVKFKLPENSNEIHYYKESISNEGGSFEYYQLSTKRVEELGGRCAPDSPEGQIGLSSISRQTIRKEGPLMSNVAANNDNPIGGYYYYVSGGQSTCGDVHTDWQTADDLMTYDMLRTPIAIN